MSDLPELLPLLEVNCSSEVNPRLKGRAKALALDWVDEDSFPAELEGSIDVIVCCEVRSIYGSPTRVSCSSGDELLFGTLYRTRNFIDSLEAIQKVTCVNSSAITYCISIVSIAPLSVKYFRDWCDP